MLTEFLCLTALTLNVDEREALRGEVNEWVKLFLPKLERKSTRKEKCRLVASVERQEFGKDENAEKWQYFKFVGNKGILYYYCSINDYKMELGEFNATSFQKNILHEHPSLSDIFISRRSDIKEENGKWELENALKERIISEGGEATIFSEKFGKVEMAVRIQIFDPFLFTKKFVHEMIKWKTYLISGKF